MALYIDKKERYKYMITETARVKEVRLSCCPLPAIITELEGYDGKDYRFYLKMDVDTMTLINFFKAIGVTDTYNAKGRECCIQVKDGICVDIANINTQLWVKASIQKGMS